MTNLEDPFEIEFSESFSIENFKMTITEDKNVHKITEELFCVLKAHFSESKETLTKNSSYYNHILEMPVLLSSCLDSAESQSENFNMKEIKLQNLKTAEACLKILIIYLESPQTTEVTKSIIQTSLKILHQAYTHCKDSEILYGEFFTELTNELAIFYKQIQEAQKATLKGLEDLINADSYDQENEESELFLLSHEIGLLCELLVSLDRNIASIFWRVFTKLISKYKDALRNLEIEVFLQPLLSDIAEILSQCLTDFERKEEVSESEVKMCIVELSVVKKIVQAFNGCLKIAFILDLRTLALQLLSGLIKISSCSGSSEKDLSIIKILLKTIRHSIASFFLEEKFFSSSFYCSSKDITCEYQVALILLKLLAIDFIRFNAENFPSQNVENLKEITSTLKENKPDDDLKLLSIKISCSLIRESKESGELFSLYQLCYTFLTEYFKCSSSVTSNILFDKSCLDIFVSSSDVVSLLISDVWIYCLRCGSVDFVFNACKTLADFCMQFQSNSKVEQFLLRALKFLASDHKIKLFRSYENIYYLFCRQNVELKYRSFQPTLFSSSAELCGEKVNSLLNHSDTSTNEDFLMIMHKACSILEFGIFAFDDMPPEEILKLIELSSILCKSDICDIQLTVIQFLRALKGKILSRNAKELNTLTSIIAELLSGFLKSNNYIIRLEAQNLYIELAESTPYPEIVKKVVMKCPQLVPSLESYLKKIPVSGFLKEEKKYLLCQKQLAYFVLEKDSNGQLSVKKQNDFI